MSRSQATLTGNLVKNGAEPRVKCGATNKNSQRICEPIHGATNQNSHRITELIHGATRLEGVNYGAKAVEVQRTTAGKYKASFHEPLPVRSHGFTAANTHPQTSRRRIILIIIKIYSFVNTTTHSFPNKIVILAC